MLSLFLKMWHTFKRIGIFTFCMLITQLIKAQLRYSQLENIEMINLKLVLCLPLILIDGANMVDFVKSSVLQGMLFWFFLLFNLEKVAPKFKLTKYKNMISRTLCDAYSYRRMPQEPSLPVRFIKKLFLIKK